MSGYRTLHREQPLRVQRSGEDDGVTGPAGTERVAIPLWAASFAPTTTSSSRGAVARGTGKMAPPAPLRLMVASADRTVRCYDVADKSLHGTGGTGGGGDPMLDASALNVSLRSVLVSSGYVEGGGAESAMQLGFTDVSVVASPSKGKGGEGIAAAIGLDGTVVVWRLRALDGDGDELSESVTIPHHKADAEFVVEDATGTSLVLRAANDTMAVAAVGCRDGSVRVFHAAPLGDAAATGAGGGDGTAVKTKKRHEPPEPGTLLTKMGAGGACVSSLSWSNRGTQIAVGRTDGIVDVFEISPDQNDWQNNYHPPSFRRVHRIPAHAKRVRAVEFSMPDDALLLTGGDDGRVHSYDVRRSAGAAAALTGSYVGHAGWILGIASCPDGKRFATSSSDRTVKVWEYATRSNVHTFDGHGDLVWGVSFSRGGDDDGPPSSAGSRLVSCGDDGTIQIYSTSV